MVKLKDLLLEKNVRLSSKKDASFQENEFVQILGLKGKVKLDRKSLSQLVKFVRGPVGRDAGLGLSFTMARRDEEKINEFKAKVVSLPNGVKAIIDFKGITFKTRTSKPVFLDRGELLKFFKGSTKYLRYEGKLNEAKETIFDVAKKVMKDKQHQNYKSKKGMVKLDMQTANLLTKVFKKVNPKMKKILSDLGYNNPAGLMNTLWAVVK